MRLVYPAAWPRSNNRESFSTNKSGDKILWKLVVIMVARFVVKIVGHILTTKRATIMTTNFHKILSPDLFVENDSLLFDRGHAAGYTSLIPSLGPHTFVDGNSDPSETLEKRAVACGNEAVSLVLTALGEDFRLWLFVADGSWREKTRIVRHHKLWKTHRALLESSAVLKIGEEVEIESEKG